MSRLAWAPHDVWQPLNYPATYHLFLNQTSYNHWYEATLWTWIMTNAVIGHLMILRQTNRLGNQHHSTCHYHHVCLDQHFQYALQAPHTKNS